MNETLHYNDMHWVTKVQAPEERAIADVSACDLGKFALNCPEVKIAGIVFCGELSHPVVIDYVSMFMEAKIFYAEQIIAGESLFMFKIDIKDAYMRFWFFGWASFPQYWDIVTRILVRVARLNGLKFL